MTLLYIFLFVVLLNCCSAELLPVQVSAIQLEFNSFVRGIINGPSDTLLVTDDNAVWSVNIEVNPPTKNLIVGSDTADYVEGTGSEARFSMPSDMILMDDTEIVISDTWNHCLRKINLETNSTSPYAGTCNRSMYLTDGYRLNATFSSPIGILRVLDKIFICDWGNHALRMLVSDNVTTLHRYFPTMYPDNFATLNDGHIYATVDNGIARINPKFGSRRNPVTVELISGSSAGGFADGSLKLSRYSNPLGIAALNNYTFAIGTRANRLRIVDLRNDLVTTICAGVRDFVEYDGHDDMCSFNETWGIHVYKDIVLVGENGGLASIPLYAIIDKSKMDSRWNGKADSPNIGAISEEMTTAPIASAYVSLSILNIMLTVILLVIVSALLVYLYKRWKNDLVAAENRKNMAQVNQIVQQVSTLENGSPVYDDASVENTPNFHRPMKY